MNVWMTLPEEMQRELDHAARVRSQELYLHAADKEGWHLDIESASGEGDVLKLFIPKDRSKSMVLELGSPDYKLEVVRRYQV